MQRSLSAFVLVAALGHWYATEPWNPGTGGSGNAPMSIHNRALLNRAAVLGLRTIEIMFVTSAGGFERAQMLVTRSGGRVGYANAAVGYVRADVPIHAMLDIVSDPAVEAYQICERAEG